MFWRDWRYRSSTIACARSLHTAVVKQRLLIGGLVLAFLILAASCQQGGTERQFQPSRFTLIWYQQTLPQSMSWSPSPLLRRMSKRLL